MSHSRRKNLVEPDHPRLSIVRQCELLTVNRSSYYYRPSGETALNLELMRLIDKQHLETPYYGARQMARHLRRQGHGVSRKRIGRLMRLMGLCAIYQKPNTSKPNLQHKIYPYLLRELTIEKPNQVWCADITYIPMRRGFLYLVAIMDWASRKVLSWRLSNTMDSDFCVDALEDALARCRFQKTAALNVRSRLHYSSGGVGSIRQRRAAAGHQRTQGGLSATGRSMRHRWPSRRGSESARIDLRCPTSH